MHCADSRHDDTTHILDQRSYNSSKSKENFEMNVASMDTKIAQTDINNTHLRLLTRAVAEDASFWASAATREAMFLLLAIPLMEKEKTKKKVQ